MIRITTVKEFIWQIADQFGEYEAYEWYDNGGIVTRSFIDLNNDVSYISRQMHRTLGEQRHVAIIGDKSYMWMCIFYGIVTSANVAVPMDVKLGAGGIADRLDFADVSVVFLSKKYACLKDEIEKSCPKVDRIINIEGYLESVPQEALSEPLLMVYPDQVSVLLFTSGTSGNGFKAAMITQGALLSGVRDYAPLYRPGDTTLSVLPIHHCFELFLGQMKASYSGVTICINDDIADLIRDLNLFKVNSMIAVPAVAKLLCSVIEKGLKSGSADEARKLLGGNFNRITIGGAASGRTVIETLKKAGIKAYNGYGLTESSGGCLFNFTTESNPEACGMNPYDDLEVKIKDGELLLRGTYIVKGYYKQPELTEEVFKDGWLHTGDMAEFADDGNVVILGRRDNMINLANGEKVYPEKLEDMISMIPGVHLAMVCAPADHLTAVILLKDDSDEVKDHVIKRIDEMNETLPGYEKITGIRFRDTPFPMTPTMKIKRRVVIEELMRDAGEAIPYVPAQNEAQAEILEHIRQLLPNADNIGIKDNLYERGLDSLTTLNLSILLKCSPALIYECRSVERIAERLEESGHADETDNGRAAPGSDTASRCTDEAVKIPGINDLIGNGAENAGWDEDGAILLTGATGYLGPHILNELSADKRRIYCLVRSVERFEKACEYYGVAVNDDIRIVTGDITLERFGLPEDEYGRLCKEVNTVFHCAASVAHAGSIEGSYEVNVKGTEEVIGFCLSSGARLYHMSSYAVTGFGTDNVLTENVLDIGQNIDRNPYVFTKYRAEECVLSARKDGVASTVFRIGNLTRRSKDGLFQMNADTNGLAAQVRAINKLKVYPENMGNVKYDDTPVDKAAKAVILLAKNCGTGKIWHIMSPDIKGISEVADAKPVSEQEFLDRLTESSGDKDIAMLSIYYRMNKDGFNPNFDFTMTLDELARLGFKW
ncbi:MAG: AMP-binding protein [Lachnospiraceae bacterium]|nr:AMP-binding protein [Lachnospiraceae bacterium]